jgi:carbamoyl-phosphate synthase large subunit
MNVLLSCAGRRNYLVEYFRAALDGGRVVATDASPYAPALANADVGLVVPLVTDPAYCDVLMSICVDHRIDLLISLNDLELPLLARQRERFADVGTTVVVSSVEVIDLCFDKWATVQLLQSVQIGAPRTYLTLEDGLAAADAGDLRFPVVLKPRWGTASIGIEFPADRHELVDAFDAVRTRVLRSIVGDASRTDEHRCILIQEMLSGPEYGLDVVNDLEGRYVTTFAKRKLSMRAGETDRAVTVNDEALCEVGRAIGSVLGHVGNLDCDVFMGPTGPVVLELNPRFGGGYPFSHMAGANLPAALITWKLGNAPNPDWLRIAPGVASAKCDRLVLAGTGLPIAPDVVPRPNRR